MQRLMNETERKNLLALLEETYPNPKCELNWTNPFTLMVAIILSAQSTDKGVNKATEELFLKVDSPEKMQNLTLEGLLPYVKTLNYYNNKAKAIINLSEKLISDFNSELPTTLELLETLPGVGRKTARVFLNVLYDAPFIGVDTHVFRLSNRLGFCRTKTPKETEDVLEKMISGPYKSKFALALVLLGRYICKAKKPLCSSCPLKKVCISDEKNNVF